ncbi:MAG: neutral zinc metallopeptidase [Propionibacteriaceae bacterium]|nr:neutral zinc metallopeptidase [Propionibacteriaceae bacterium]
MSIPQQTPGSWDSSSQYSGGARQAWAPTSSGREPNNTLIALGVTFLVVTALVLGIGLAGSRAATNGSYDGGPEGNGNPGFVTTPTVAPSSEPVLVRNPVPPPGRAPGATDPSTGEWVLPAWEWDVLPQLADGADDEWITLQAAALAAVAPPEMTGCEVPTEIADRKSYEVAVRRQWNCVHEAWLPILQDLDWSTGEPDVQFFDGAGARSPCGYVEAPAFYCPAGDGTVHFGGDDLDMAMEWDLTINESVHHEYAHHLQNLAGIMEAAEYVGQTSDVDRRIELQATCLSGAMTFHNEAAAFDQHRWGEWRDSLNESVLDDEHGDRDSLLYWGTRGLYAATVGDCNTWSVPPERVS